MAVPSTGDNPPGGDEGRQSSLATISSDDGDGKTLAGASDLLRPLLRDPEKAQHAAKQVVSYIETHSGPIPHPRILSGYDAIVPGSAREIIEMAKSEQKHRHTMEMLERLYPYLGLIGGFIALLICVIGAVLLALNDKTEAAIALVGVPVLGVITIAIKSRIDAMKPKSVPSNQAAKKNPPRRK